MPHPTTRVLAVLELLQSRVQVSGAELARRLEVDRRTLRRYITMLEEMGIPITTEQGRHGGDRMVARFQPPPMVVTHAEGPEPPPGRLGAPRPGLAHAP